MGGSADCWDALGGETNKNAQGVRVSEPVGVDGRQMDSWERRKLAAAECPYPLQDLCVADNDDAVLGAGQRNVEAPRVVQETCTVERESLVNSLLSLSLL